MGSQGATFAESTTPHHHRSPGWSSSQEETGRDPSTGCTPTIFRLEKTTIFQDGRQVRRKLEETRQQDVRLQFSDWRKLLSSKMVVKSGGNWKRPVNRMYAYNFQIGENYYLPMTSYLETKTGTSTDIPGPLCFSERIS